uniref:NAD(P)(+)--arginine ADP-ribosyltransferase n=1 Tax=Electrophorus electricus TaxID=8005 RepID=A0A4W4GZH8_ELEEL
MIKALFDLPLDMANKSVDDAFEGCRDQMRELVIRNYLQQELNSSTHFATVWKTAIDKVNSTKSELNKTQAAAIYVYTLGGQKQVYQLFNNACRNGKNNYINGSFQFYSLYFFLTDAIQYLKSNNPFCLTSYRRTKVAFKTDVLNQEIRFGSFTSSSLLQNLSHFGHKSCFIIHTCFGAEVYNYSSLKTHEKEVLIPPYEVFKVTKSEQKDPWCDVEYELQSTRKRSDLNCVIAEEIL